MTAKERREMRRLEVRIEVLEADQKRHMAAYVNCLHTIVEQETALRNALDALEEAVMVIRAGLEKH